MCHALSSSEFKPGDDVKEKFCETEEWNDCPRYDVAVQAFAPGIPESNDDLST